MQERVKKIYFIHCNIQGATASHLIFDGRVHFRQLVDCLARVQ